MFNFVLLEVAPRLYHHTRLRFRVPAVIHSCDNYEQQTAEGHMDINKILAELRSERDDIERAIIALEKFGGKRRGRPPLWMKTIEEPAQTKPRKKQSKDQGTD